MSAPFTVTEAAGSLDAPEAAFTPSSVSPLLEETLLPSEHSVELDRTPERDWLERFTAGEPHVAELFHANSRISPHGSSSVPLDVAELERTRHWYESTSYRPRPGDVDGARASAGGITFAAAALPGATGRWLTALARPELVRLAYPLALLLVRPGSIHRLTPDGTTLWLERHLDDPAMTRLREALHAGDEVRGAEALLFVAIAPWRYMVFQGPRGYRRTLVEAGRFLAALDAAAQAVGVRTETIHDFHDVRVDAELNLDGTERMSLCAVACLGERTSASEEDEDGGHA